MTKHRTPLPPEVNNVVVALCADYDRRAELLRRHEAPAEVLELCYRLNSGIDRALAEVCEEGIRNDIRRSIAERRGARRSLLPILGEGAYKRRKRDSEYRIAEVLRLL